MRTTLDLPEDLLIEAMKVTEIKTKTKVIITALEELIRKSKISEIKQYKGIKGRIPIFPVMPPALDYACLPFVSSSSNALLYKMIVA